MKSIIKFFILFVIISDVNSQNLKSPSEFLGYEIGTQFSRHSQVVDYFDHIASEMNKNVSLVNYGKTYEKKILNALEQTILPDLHKNLKVCFHMSPNDFKNDYNSMHGAGFSIAPIFTQSAWFRYHNKDKKIKNLYFSAAGSHPGAGIPGVLSSAKVVENIIKSETK